MIPVSEYKGVGDRVKEALDLIGITQDRVTRIFGSCFCKEAQGLLNRLGAWASRVLNGKREKAREYLDEILEGVGNEATTSGDHRTQR